MAVLCQQALRIQSCWQHYQTRSLWGEAYKRGSKRRKAEALARYIHKLVSFVFRSKWCADLILMSVSILVLLVHLAASICSQVHSALVEALQCSCNAPNSLRTQRREGVLIA